MGEDANALSELDQHLRMALDPQGELESLLVDQIVSSMWRLRRLYRIEAGVLTRYQRGAEKEREKDWDSPTRIERIIDEEGHGGAVARLDRAALSARPFGKISGGRASFFRILPPVIWE